jgi:hypothetical protein
MGVTPPVDVAPREAVVARRRGGHDDLLGVGGERRRRTVWEEVADASEVAIAGGSDDEVDVADRAKP